MRVLTLIALLASHLWAALPFWHRTRSGRVPDVEDFATLSVVLYYDVGIVLELLGYPYPSPFFLPFLSSEPATFGLAVAILFAAPWLLRLGAVLTRGESPPDTFEPRAVVPRRKGPIFYGLALSITGLLAAVGSMSTLQHPLLWISRMEMGTRWGPLIPIFYVPLHLLAYYVRQRNSRQRFGLAVSVWLIVAAVLSSIGVGQRTNVLLPILVFLLFRYRFTLPRISIAAVGLLIAASVTLPLFKYSFSDSHQGIGELLVHTLYTDVSRAQVLTDALEKSTLSGTEILPYPMAGYWYSAWFFVPRAVAPFKLNSTQSYLTATFVGGDPATLEWGLALGAIEELLLNAGVLWVPVGLLVLGAGMGLLDRLSFRLPSLLVPTRLAGLWFCGYHLPALLLLFATMAAVCWICHALFSQPIDTPSPVPSRARREHTSRVVPQGALPR